MSDTIPETVAAVLAHDATASPARNWSKPSGYDPDAMCSYYYRTAAPALAREVQRLRKLEDDRARLRQQAFDDEARLLSAPAVNEAEALHYANGCAGGGFTMGSMGRTLNAFRALLQVAEERDTARAECERLRAGLVEALGYALGTDAMDVETNQRLRALAEVPQ